jgi:hypothetical protein
VANARCEECRGDEGGHHVWCSKETASDVLTTCWGCGKWSATLYCDGCSKTKECPHGNVINDGCDACDVEGDIAYDSQREGRKR